MSLEQYVNLTKNIASIDTEISSSDRCGTLSVDLTAEKTDSAVVYKAKITSLDGNATYNRKEMKRNANFKTVKGITGVVDEKTIRINDIKLPAAGGNKYKIEAKDAAGNVVSSSIDVKTKRKLYYQVISMKGGSHPSKFDGFKKEFDKYHIDMKELDDGRNKLKFLKTIHKDNEGVLFNEARKVYSIKRIKPYAIAVVFSHMIADYIENVNTDSIDITIPSRLSSVFSKEKVEIIIDLKDDYNDKAFLWQGLDINHDKVDKFWLISAKFISTTGRVFDIPRDNVILHGSPVTVNGGFSQVKISLDGDQFRNLITSNVGRIELRTKVVDGFSGGFATGDSNFITIANRAWWSTSDSSDDKLIQILNHEMGHKVGMSATGDRPKPADPSHYSFIDTLTPDSHADLYGEYYEGPNENGYGHQGPHCKMGVSYKASDNSWSGGKPGCVMFGATSMIDTNDGVFKPTPKEFCAKCGEAVRKLDLDGNNRAVLTKQF